jgi:hypothetical protein
MRFVNCKLALTWLNRVSGIARHSSAANQYLFTDWLFFVSSQTSQVSVHSETIAILKSDGLTFGGREDPVFFKTIDKKGDAHQTILFDLNVYFPIPAFFEQTISTQLF